MYEWLKWPLIILAIAFLTNGFNFVTINKHYHGKEEDK